MPRVGVTVYDLLLSCPGDVVDLKDTISACVKSFNSSIGDANNIRIELKHWSTDSFSQSGDKPQNILNKQFINDCDLCVALLGTRFGTPTENYDSGTEEEIEKMLEQNKQVFLYFVERSVDPSKIELEQYKKVQEFRSKYIDKGVYTVVKNAEELRAEFQNALSLYFIKLVAPNTKQLQSTLAPKLVITSTNAEEKNIVPFHTNYQNVKLVKEKETSARELIEKISAIKVIVSEKKTDEETESTISDEELSDMTVADAIRAAENRTISSKQFHRVMGTKAPVCRKVEIDEIQLNCVSTFCEQHGIFLNDDFYSLGNLYKETKFPIIVAFGDSSTEYLGSESEIEKYELLEKLFMDIQEYNQVREFFSNIDAMPCISLMVENIGNTYDEDIDIKLFIEKDCFADIDIIPEPGVLFLEEIVKWEAPKTLFAGNSDAEIEEFSNYPSRPYIPQPFSFPFKGRDEKIAEQREAYQELLEEVFCYDVRKNADDDILCFNIPYLKQNTKMFFPSYLFLAKEPKSLRYEIRSKHSPEVYKGTLIIESGDEK